MSDIIVDTYKLNQYAQRLSTVNSRINRLDFRMDSLYLKVGFLGLKDLLQADAMTGYSWRLLRCQTYLSQTASEFERLEKKLENEDPLSFNKSSSLGIGEMLFDVGVAIKKGAEKVSSVVAKVVNYVLESYYSQETFYELIQYGKAILKGAKGVAKIVTGMGALFGTGGLSAPVAILSIISGINDVCNAMMDATYTYTKQYDMIGQNMLKDSLVEGGKIIGASLGNEKIGELFGNITYYGIDIVTSLATLEVSMDKIKQLSSTNMAELGAEIKEIANLDVSKIFTTDLEMLRYQTKLAGYMFKQTANFISNASQIIKIGGEAIEIGRGINDIYTSTYDTDFKNPVLDTIDVIEDVKNVATGSFKIGAWDYKETGVLAKRVDSVFVRAENKVFLSKSFSDFADNIKSYTDTVNSTVESGKRLLFGGE